MKLIGNRIPEKIVIPVDISDIYFSVKTASFNSYRQQTVFLTWAQTVAMDQVLTVTIILWLSLCFIHRYHLLLTQEQTGLMPLQVMVHIHARTHTLSLNSNVC